MSDFATRFSQYREDVSKANILNKAVVFDALASAGITQLTIEFDGEGDSGSAIPPSGDGTLWHRVW